MKILTIPYDEVEKVFRALDAALDVIEYGSEDTEMIGYRPCCGVLSFDPHSDRCQLNNAHDIMIRWMQQ